MKQIKILLCLSFLTLTLLTGTLGYCYGIRQNIEIKENEKDILKVKEILIDTEFNNRFESDIAKNKSLHLFNSLVMIYIFSNYKNIKQLNINLDNQNEFKTWLSKAFQSELDNLINTGEITLSGTISKIKYNNWTIIDSVKIIKLINLLMNENININFYLDINNKITNFKIWDKQLSILNIYSLETKIEVNNNV